MTNYSGMTDEKSSQTEDPPQASQSGENPQPQQNHDQAMVDQPPQQDQEAPMADFEEAVRAQEEFLVTVAREEGFQCSGCSDFTSHSNVQVFGSFCCLPCYKHHEGIFCNIRHGPRCEANPARRGSKSMYLKPTDHRADLPDTPWQLPPEAEHIDPQLGMREEHMDNMD